MWLATQLVPHVSTTANSSTAASRHAMAWARQTLQQARASRHLLRGAVSSALDHETVLGPVARALKQHERGQHHVRSRDTAGSPSSEPRLRLATTSEVKSESASRGVRDALACVRRAFDPAPAIPRFEATDTRVVIATMVVWPDDAAKRREYEDMLRLWRAHMDPYVAHVRCGTARLLNGPSHCPCRPCTCCSDTAAATGTAWWCTREEAWTRLAHPLGARCFSYAGCWTVTWVA